MIETNLYQVEAYFLAWKTCLLFLQTELLREEVVRQRPHIGALAVVGSSAVSPFSVLVRQDFRSFLWAGLLRQGRHHLARMPGVDSIVPRACGEQYARALPIGIAGFCCFSENVVVAELGLAEDVVA